MSDLNSGRLIPMNTWEYVELLRTQLTNSDFVRDISFENAWSELSNEYSGVIDRNNKSSSTPLADFLFSAEFGFYPRPEILLFLVESFEYYFLMKGEVSLEDIFFGKQKKGVGNHSAQRARKEMTHQLELEFIGRDLGLSENPKATDLDLAEEIINRHNLDIDPESLLRKYRRNKNEDK